MDEEKETPIQINNKELDYLYLMCNIKKEKAIHFNQIEKMGTIKKISKDGFMSAIITLAYHNEKWYWRTEIMDDTTPENFEYVIELPKTLTKKINDKSKDKATK